MVTEHVIDEGAVLDEVPLVFSVDVDWGVGVCDKQTDERGAEGKVG